eukprot:303278_1
MGNPATKIQADKFGDWQSHNPCNCNKKYLVITLMKHKSVPLTKQSVVVTTNIARVGTCGISDAAFFGIQSFTHDVIQFSLTCIHCNWKGCCTLDYSNNANKEKKRYGKYCKVYDNAFFAVNTYRPRRKFTLTDLQQEYETNFDWKAKDYKLTHFNSNLERKNCKTYASYIFDTISRKY